MNRGEEARRLGHSELAVSPLALGSWRTFERIGFDTSLAIFTRARELGVTFLDDARYDDETGAAELATGYSEVLFGRLLRASGWPRDEVVIANKLWWEHWPRENATTELRGSLERMELECVDLIYAVTLPRALGVTRAVHEIGALLSDGLARTWGVANWPAAQLAEAVRAADRLGVPAPVAAQLPYSLVDRSHVATPAMAAALAASGAGLVPSAVLAGGLLSGKYADGGAAGDRMTGALDGDASRAALVAARELAELAATLDTTPAALAIAFALQAPQTVSVLFGATSVAQLEQNVAALALADRLDDDARARLRAIGRPLSARG